MQKLLILGGGIGGLSASIYARLNGYDVTLLEKSSFTGGKAGQVVVNGYHFDPGPSIMIMPWVYRDIFALAGKNFDDYIELIPLKYMFSLIDSNNNIYKFPINRDLILNYVRENFIDDYASFKKIFDIGDKIYPLTKKTVFESPFLNFNQLLNLNFIKMGFYFNPLKTHKNFVDEIFKSDILRALFYGFPSYSGLTYNDANPGALLIPYIMANEGVYYPKGGIGNLVKVMESLAIELGVNFNLNEDIKQINLEKNFIKSVQTQKSTYYADFFISNIDKQTTKKLAGIKSLDYKASFSFATYQIGYKGQIDYRIDHHTLLLPEDWMAYYDDLYNNDKFYKNQIIYVNRNSITESMDHKQNDNLFFVLTVPSLGNNFDWNKFDIKNYIVEQLRKFKIELDISKIEAERIQTPLYFEEAHSNYKGALYGPTKKNWTWQMFPQKNLIEGIKNLSLCGGTVQPGAGLPMSALSGKFAVNLLKNLKNEL